MSRGKRYEEPKLNMKKVFAVILAIAVIIMFIFVTALGLNTRIWVIVWTIFAQVVIVIGNYVLSKLIVFKNK